MKIARYRHKGTTSYGALIDTHVIDLPELAKECALPLPDKLSRLISGRLVAIENARKLVSRATHKQITGASIKLEEVVLLAPIPFPHKIICLGLNYRDHAAEQGRQPSAEPILFMKPHTAIIGPGENVVKPSFVGQLDYEAELAVVVGSKAKNISVANAGKCIFGYTILNDVSARDIQFRDKQWTRGKSFDTFAPTGPCITTRDQLSETSNLRIRTWVNDEIRQNSTTRNMILTVPQIIHELSRVMTLEPCDIIATGTPAGVGFAMKPKPQFLNSGDTVRIQIEGIGTLTNAVIEQT